MAQSRLFESEVELYGGFSTCKLYNGNLLEQNIVRELINKVKKGYDAPTYMDRFKLTGYRQFDRLEYYQWKKYKNFIPWSTIKGNIYDQESIIEEFKKTNPNYKCISSISCVFPSDDFWCKYKAYIIYQYNMDKDILKYNNKFYQYKSTVFDSVRNVYYTTFKAISPILKIINRKYEYTVHGNIVEIKEYRFFTYQHAETLQIIENTEWFLFASTGISIPEGTSYPEYSLEAPIYEETKSEEEIILELPPNNGDRYYLVEYIDNNNLPQKYMVILIDIKSGIFQEKHIAPYSIIMLMKQGKNINDYGDDDECKKATKGILEEVGIDLDTITKGYNESITGDAKNNLRFVYFHLAISPNIWPDVHRPTISKFLFETFELYNNLMPTYANTLVDFAFPEQSGLNKDPVYMYHDNIVITTRSDPYYYWFQYRPVRPDILDGVYKVVATGKNLAVNQCYHRIINGDDHKVIVTHYQDVLGLIRNGVVEAFYVHDYVIISYEFIDDDYEMMDGGTHSYTKTMKECYEEYLKEYDEDYEERKQAYIDAGFAPEGMPEYNPNSIGLFWSNYCAKMKKQGFLLYENLPLEQKNWNYNQFLAYYPPHHGILDRYYPSFESWGMLEIVKQINSSQYKIYRIRGLYGQHIVADYDDSVAVDVDMRDPSFYIPVYPEVINKFSYMEQTELLGECFRLTFYMAKEVSTPWYQTVAFAGFIKGIMICITFVSFFYGFVSIGIKLAAAGITSMTALTFFETILAPVLITAAVGVSIKVIEAWIDDPLLKTALSAAVMIAGMVGINFVQTGGFNLGLNLNTALGVAGIAVNSVDIYTSSTLKLEAERLQKEADAFNTAYEERMKEISEALESLNTGYLTAEFLASVNVGVNNTSNDITTAMLMTPDVYHYLALEAWKDLDICTEDYTKNNTDYFCRASTYLY